MYVVPWTLLEAFSPLRWSPSNRGKISGGRKTFVWAPWVSGRVDRRVSGDWDSLYSGIAPITWYPSFETNRNFGVPDSWPSNTSTLQHGTSIVYGWFSYWQALFKYAVGVQVPDTMSFTLNPHPPVEGITSGSTGTMDYGAPGSAQQTWAVSALDWYPTDGNPFVAANQMGGFGHEYGHAIVTCAGAADGHCYMSDPVHVPPSNPLDWRHSVWNAAFENLPSFIGTTLSEFRSPYNGGANTFEPTWRYGGYFDTTDNFASFAEDSANFIDCPSVACPTGYSCIAPSYESPRGFSTSHGICARDCDSLSDCSSTAPNICLNHACPICVDKQCGPYAYKNQWFTNVGARLTFDTGWLTALRMLLIATGGNDLNGMRDFNIGTDTWYDALADQGISVAAVTRAVRSVTNEYGVTSRDDFADSRVEALPIPVVSSAGTPLRWGSGSANYPQLDSTLDSDWFVFRGTYNASYTVSANPFGGSSVDLAVWVYRIDGTLLATSSAPTGPGASLATGALPANDWYAVKIANRVPTSGRYTANIRLTSTIDDDFSNVTAESYPLPSGVTQSGNLGALDIDRFQIFVPQTSGALQVVVSSSPTAVVEVFAPSGTTLGSAYGSITIPQSTIASNGVGHYLIDVRDVSSVARAYSITATLTCASSTTASCDNRSTNPPLQTRYTWGDRFAGRLPATGTTASYSVYLTANESASVGLVSDSASCQFVVDLVPPTVLAYFAGNPVFSWTENNTSGQGTGARDAAGSGRGAGGHLYAPVAGNYKLVVRQVAGGTCAFRLLIAKSGETTFARPEW